MCASIRAQSTVHCSHCGCATATRPLQLGDCVPDRRRGAAATVAPGPGVAANLAAPTLESQLAGDVEPDQPQRHAIRAVGTSAETKNAARSLERGTLSRVPLAVASRFASCWAEALEGSMAGDNEWAFLARYRCRLLLAPVPEGADRNAELKRRLQMWEQGSFDDLTRRVAGQQLEANRRDGRKRAERHAGSEERKGRAARRAAAAGAVGKAVKGLVGGVATGSAAERARWTADLIPRSAINGSPCTRPEEATEAGTCAWGAGDVDRARREMKEAGRRPGGPPGIPWVRLPPLSAPGPTGERQEHLDDVMNGAGVSQRRRLTRALDDLTVRWAINALPPACRWLLNTQALFLLKVRDPVCKEFDDEEWLQLLESDTAGAGDEWAQDVPDSEIVAEGLETEADIAMPPQADSTVVAPIVEAPMPAANSGPARPKVRPIQMGEFMRKWVSRRLLQLNGSDIDRVMAAARQLGVRSRGGAEALAIFQQIVYDLWKAGHLERPLARVKIDEKNCFGSLEWPAVRQAVQQSLPRHSAVTCWKHAEASAVEQSGLDGAPKDRGAEQGTSTAHWNAA